MKDSQQVSKILSVIFHPIIYPLLATLFFIYFTPKFIHYQFKWLILTIVFVGTVLLPILVLNLLKSAHYIESFRLEKLTDRRYPFFIFTILALMLGRIFFKFEFTNDLRIYFIAGSMSFLVGYWFLFLKQKVSIHTMGLGSFLGFIIHLSWTYHYNFLFWIGLAFILFGIVAKARMDLGRHILKEVLWGFVIGVLPQLVLPLFYQNI